MNLIKLNSVISDAALLTQGYVFYEGFLFSAIRHPANVFDAITIRNPESARYWGEKTVYSERTLQEHIDFINMNGIEKATVIAEDISFLKQCPTLKHINIYPAITADDQFDYTPLYGLDGITSLFCATQYGQNNRKSTTIDYSKICGLESLHVTTSNERNFQQIPTLRSLQISYNNCETLLQELFCSQELDSLELNACKIHSLAGLENAPKMQCIYLNNNRLLTDISSLMNSAKTIKALRIQNCPKVQDFSILSELKELEYLFLGGSNSIPSLEFIHCLPNLKTFIFDMNVIDGNLLPCMDLSYVHCGRNRRHYNVKTNELPKGEFVRGNENIEMWRRII